MRASMTLEARESLLAVRKALKESKCETSADLLRLLRALRDEINAEIDSITDDGVNMEEM